MRFFFKTGTYAVTRFAVASSVIKVPEGNRVAAASAGRIAPIFRMGPDKVQGADRAKGAAKKAASSMESLGRFGCSGSDRSFTGTALGSSL
jgi:hypothetical protein